MPQKKKATRTTFEDLGREFDARLIEIVDYMEREVVPTARKHSTRALRVAAKKLGELADYMEVQRRK